VSKGCICECLEDVQGSFGLSVNVVRVLPERHSSIVGHSKCCGGVGVGNRYVVECDCGLCVVFAGPRLNKC